MGSNENEDETNIFGFKVDPENFDQLSKDLYEEAQKIDKDLRKYKNAFFSQLDNNVTIINLINIRSIL